MDDSNISSNPLQHDNFVDKAAHSADRAVDATKAAATQALDKVSDKVEAVRSTLSPQVDRALAPFDAVVRYTREQPLAALAAAATAGALLTALMRPTRRVRVRR
jgi:ElaB/YqjD/DUF883 family membrane-anchored ribosome-binding protein